MTKLKKITLFLLILILGFSVASCNDDKKYDITGVTNAEDVVIKKDEKLLTFKVGSEINTFNSSNITVSGGKAVVYGTKECKDELNVLTLNDGTNTFYLKIRLDKGNKLLKKIVWKLVITKEASNQDAKKVAETLEKVTAPKTATEDFTLKEVEGVVWSLKEASIAAKISGNKVTVTRQNTDVDVVLVATATFGEASDSKEFTVKVLALEVVETLDKEKLMNNLAIMAAVLETGALEGYEFEKALDEILASERQKELFNTIIEGIEKANLTNKRANDVIKLVQEKFVGRVTNFTFENLAEGITDTVKRVLAIINEIDTIVSPEELSIIVHTYYVNSELDNAGFDELLAALKAEVSPELYQDLIDTINESSATLLSQAEFTDVFLDLFRTAKVLASMGEREYNAISDIIELVSAEKFDASKITEADLQNVNIIGEVVLDLSEVLNKEMINKIVGVVLRLVEINEDTVSILGQIGYIDLAVNAPTALKFVGEILTNVDINSFKGLMGLIESIMADLPSGDEALVELGKNVHESSLLIGGAYNKLTDAQKLELKETIKKIIDLVAVSITIDTDAILDYVSSVSQMIISNLDYKQIGLDFVKTLTKQLENKLITTASEEIIVKQNTSIETFITLLNEKLAVTYLTYNTETGEYDKEEITLKQDNIQNYNLTDGGIQRVTITVKGHSTQVAYYVMETKPQYALAPDELRGFSGIFVYDLDGNRYTYAYTSQEQRFTFVNKNTYAIKNFEIAVDKIQILEPDYKTVGIKHSVAMITLEDGSNYYLPITYYTVDKNTSNITKMEVHAIDKIFQNSDKEIRGSLAIYKNYGVKLLEDNKWNNDNIAYFSFEKEHISNLDITKAGKQTITVEVSGYKVSCEVEVISEAAAKNINYMYAYVNSETYLGSPNYEDLLNLNINFINDEYNYYGTYKELANHLAEKGLQYEVSISFGDLQVGENECTITLTNKETGQIKVEEFTLTLVDKDEYNKITSLEVYFTDKVFIGLTDRQIINRVDMITYGNSYFKETKSGTEAALWLSQNCKIEKNQSENKIIFIIGSESFSFDGVFEVNVSMVDIMYKLNTNYLPTFFKTFDEEELANLIISNMYINGTLVINSGDYEYCQDVFLKIGSIEKTPTGVNVKIGDDTVKEFTYQDENDFKVFYNYLGRLFVNESASDANAIFNSINTISINYEMEETYENIYVDRADIIKKFVQKGFLSATPNKSEGSVIISFTVGEKKYEILKPANFYQDDEAKNIALIIDAYQIEVFQSGLEKTLEKALENAAIDIRYYDGTKARLVGSEIVDLINAGKLTAILETYDDYNYLRYQYGSDILTVSVNYRNLTQLKTEETTIIFDAEKYDSTDLYKAIKAVYVAIYLDSGSWTYIELTDELAVKFVRDFCTITCNETDELVQYTYSINGYETTTAFLKN